MFAFDELLGHFPEGFDEGGVIASAGEVHCFFEVGAEFGIERGFELADVGFDFVQLARHLGVFGNLIAPVGPHGFDVFDVFLA